MCVSVCKSVQARADGAYVGFTLVGALGVSLHAACLLKQKHLVALRAYSSRSTWSRRSEQSPCAACAPHSARSCRMRRAIQKKMHTLRWPPLHVQGLGRALIPDSCLMACGQPHGMWTASWHVDSLAAASRSTWWVRRCNLLCACVCVHARAYSKCAHMFVRLARARHARAQSHASAHITGDGRGLACVGRRRLVVVEVLMAERGLGLGVMNLRGAALAVHHCRPAEAHAHFAHTRTTLSAPGTARLAWQSCMCVQEDNGPGAQVDKGRPGASLRIMHTPSCVPSPFCLWCPSLCDARAEACRPAPPPHALMHARAHSVEGQAPEAAQS